jgi:type IV pilus assembly protein PilM
MIGIDWGACSLRAVQLHQTASGWRIHHWVNIESEPETAEPPPPDYEKELHLAFGPGTFTGQQIGLLLSPPQVDLQLIDVPEAVLELPPAQMREALQIELDRHLPWPSNTCEIAAWPVGPASGGRCSAMVTATRTSEIQQRLDTLETAGLEALRADIVPNAIIELCPGRAASSTQETESTVWSVVDIGFEGARLYLAHDDRVVYARNISGGGRDITKTLSDALKVEFAVAERYKRVYGIEQTDRGFRSVTGGLAQISEESLPGVLFAIVRPTLDVMIKEIERAYRFALGKIPGSSPGPLWLVGGGARLKGLTAVLGNGLGVPVACPDPEHVLVPRPASGNHPALTDANCPVLAGCIGLAMMGDRE